MAKHVGMGRKKPGARTGGWEEYFDRDEHLIWQGQPNKGLRFRGKALAESAFGLIFVGFAIFWMLMAKTITSGFSGSQGIFSYFPLFGIPFLLVGLYMVVGKYFWQAFMRGRTRYALTNKRAFIATRGLTNNLKSWPIGPSTPLDFEPGNEASLFFATSTKRYNSNGRSKMRTLRHGFEYISDGDEVYHLMRDLVKTMN